MEPLIYYPTFEPPDETWLKFALLYFEKFEPIVPYENHGELSDNFKRIMDKSDLVTLYSPTYGDAYNATLLAIEEANSILSAPYERSYLFKEINLKRKWQTLKHSTFEICRGKFSHDWVYFCQQNEIGIETEKGIRLPEELAFIYMTYLAREIAFKESAAIITDNNAFDSFTNLNKFKSQMAERRQKFAKGIINLMVPKNLDQIPINRVLKFRRDKRELIRAFNFEMDNVQNKISEGYSEQDFIDRYNNIYSDISIEIIKFGIGLSAVPFGIYALINNHSALSQSYIKEVLGAIGMTLGGTYGLHKGLRDTQTKRYCKKYLANLKRLR